MKEQKNSSNLTDKTIFSRLKSRDKQAFIDAYDKYIDDIYRFVFFKVNQHEEAEDISSQVFLKTWNYIQNKSITDYKTLKALLYTVARNSVIDHYRKKNKEHSIAIDQAESNISIPDNTQNIQEQLELKSDFENIEIHLLELKEEYREVVILRYVNELNFAEIATILNKSKGNVRVILYRAIKALKEIINKE